MADILSRPQPQIAQLELLFAGPLVKDSQVENYADLILLDIAYNYRHKLVWVKEHSTFYYLENGDGSEPTNWSKLSARVVISKYFATSTYLKGETVYLSGKIYIALQNVPLNTSPADYENYWLCIAGQTETYRYLFENTSSVIVYTEIRNPKFEIILGTFDRDGNGQIIIDPTTGLAQLSNKEIVEAYIKCREDLEPNNGIAYEISFFEDEELSEQLSGCINVK